MVCFLKCSEKSPFHYRPFCRRTINRFSHAFLRALNIFTNGAMILKIHSACNFADVIFSSEKLLLCVYCACTSESKPAYFCLLCMCNMSKSGFGKFQSKKVRILPENFFGKAMFIFFTNDKSGTLRGYMYFWNTPLIFMIFRNEHGRAVMVGRYVIGYSIVCPLRFH